MNSENRLYYVVEVATAPGLYDNIPSFFGALAGSPTFAYTVFPGIQDAFRAWAVLQFPAAFTTSSAAAWSLYPLDGSWSVRCNRPFDTVHPDDLWLLNPPREEECDDPPPPDSHLPLADVDDAPSTAWPPESAYMTPPASPPPSSPALLSSDIANGPPPAPPSTPSFEPAFDPAAPAEVLVVEETVVLADLVDRQELGGEHALREEGVDEGKLVDAGEGGRTDQDGVLLREQIDNAPEGQAYFAITRGFRVGVFTGPYERIRAHVAKYDGAHFCGFKEYQDAAAWFLEHALD
ncbi:hypothetical protein FA95DRAFT_1578267 [Auriscalpium vulgare]|uniref:Uncharacterized protein n=1 Tax=Auriscalpium vulgare TaxID=40419 RepID=A0ACB8R2I8_9AGAM|nr:hypothetical protein FA95DRAFT_1578267 [Auriscalpium vulgare]